MLWTQIIDVDFDRLPRWLWLALSAVPDLVLFACVAWLWIWLVRTRRQARQQLAEASDTLARRLRLVAETASDVVMETDNAGVIRWITPSVRLRIGREPDDLIGELFSSLVHPDDRDHLRAMEDQLNGGVIAVERLRLRATLEGMLDPLAIVEPVRNDERHEAAERLAASAEQFRLLAENSTDIILRLDPDDTILWISPSVTPVLGWPPADAIGRDGKEFLATEETREQFKRDKARVLAGHGAVSRARVRAADGEIHWMEVHTFPYRTTGGAVSGMVASMHVIDEQLRMEQDLEHRARIDSLTGLYNRRELLERLAAAVAGREPSIALLWCDIDSFKAINDAHGHAAGDAVLAALGTRIRGCLRSADDMAGRISGDELIVVLQAVTSLDEATACAEELRRRTAEPIRAGDGVINSTISIGATLAGPGEGIDAILARADDAMYEAKQQGKNRVVAMPPPACVTAAS